MNNKTNILGKSKRNIIYAALLGIISGLFSFMFLAFINFMVEVLISGTYLEVNYTYILIYLLILVGFIWFRRALSFQIIKLSQNLFWRLRIKVIKMVLNSEYSQLASKRNEIHSALVQDVGALTQASLSIIDFITSLVVVIACLFYMGILSLPLFFATLITSFFGVTVYQLGAKKNNQKFVVTRNLEDGFMKYFNAIIIGFKDIYVDPSKGTDIYQRKVKSISKDALENNTGAFVYYLNNQITGQILFYALIGAILLFFSTKLEIKGMTIVNFLFILLYFLGAIETLMVLLPTLLKAKISLNRIRKLEKKLISVAKGDNFESNIITTRQDRLKSLSIRSLEFNYEHDSTDNNFGIGPINAEIKKGEVVFIYGGNGSGKTTLIYAILGLLKPDKGEIWFNNKMLIDENYTDYKNMFSVVFNDFYLFDEFYGNQNFNKSDANAYLDLFELDDKVKIEDTGFTTVDLSTGQRKRLALITAILEEKSIIILDEWAADQDPYFRKKFYTEIIPNLKGKGISIIAITHDDTYYDCCDKLFKMEYGQLINESITTND